MKNLVIKGVECRINENAVAELNLEHVARGLGFLKRDSKNGVVYERINKQFLQKHLYSFGILDSENDELPNFIPENIFYKLCFKAENEIAKAFQDLVTDEILPSIRKHGAYMTNETLEKAILSPDFIIKLATNLKEEQVRRVEAEKQVETMRPKADFVDRAVDTGHLVDVGQAAKILKLPFGRNTFFSKLKEKGVFFKNKNEPKQQYVDRGYFELREKEIQRANNPSFMITVVLVTQKGLYWLSKEFSASTDFNMPKLNVG